MANPWEGAAAAPPKLEATLSAPPFTFNPEATTFMPGGERIAAAAAIAPPAAAAAAARAGSGGLARRAALLLVVGARGAGKTALALHAEAAARAAGAADGSGGWVRVAWEDGGGGGPAERAALERAAAALRAGSRVVVDPPGGALADASTRAPWVDAARRSSADALALVLHATEGECAARAAARAARSGGDGAAAAAGAVSDYRYFAARMQHCGPPDRREGFAAVFHAHTARRDEANVALAALGIAPLFERFWEAAEAVARFIEQPRPVGERRDEPPQGDEDRRQKPEAAVPPARPARPARNSAPSYGRLPRAPPFGGLLLLFDLNGTLTSHSAQRRSTGITALRPGAAAALVALRAAGRVRLGVFSSATWRTVGEAVSMLQRASGLPPGERLFDVVLNRDQCQLCPGLAGKAWDTNKPLAPLAPWTGVPVERTLLVDDDEHKAAPGERAQLLLVPTWDGRADCPVAEWLAEELLARLPGEPLVGARVPHQRGGWKKRGRKGRWNAQQRSERQQHRLGQGGALQGGEQPQTECPQAENQHDAAGAVGSGDQNGMESGTAVDDKRRRRDDDDSPDGLTASARPTPAATPGGASVTQAANDAASGATPIAADAAASAEGSAAEHASEPEAADAAAERVEEPSYEPDAAAEIARAVSVSLAERHAAWLEVNPAPAPAPELEVCADADTDMATDGDVPTSELGTDAGGEGGALAAAEPEPAAGRGRGGDNDGGGSGGSGGSRSGEEVAAIEHGNV